MFDNLITLIDGFYWPSYDGEACRETTISRWDTPLKISKYCKNFNTIITAGANVGYYVKQYAKLFKKVYAFEPELINFECLNLNIKEKNVVKIPGALGNSNNKTGLINHCNDSGAWRVSGDGEIQIYRIDDLKLDGLDLLALDVEGSELTVLQGGIETIKKYWPVISVEANDETDACKFLKTIGYGKVGEVNGDWVFKKR